jgi:Chaperone of endosialidase
MSNITITNLPVATSVSGSAQLIAVQSGTSVSVTAQQIANLNANSGTVTSITAQSPLSGGTITTTGTIGLNTNSVTNSYLSTMAANTIKGNNSGSAAQPQDLTVSQTMLLLGAAPLASPAFTGTPTAPTASSSDNSTKIATTAFVKAQSYGSGTVTSITAGAGLSGGTITTSGTISLPTTGVSASTYGSTTALPQITVDAYGRITAASNVTITPSNIGAASSSTTITAGTGLSGGGDLSANRTLSLASIGAFTILSNNSSGSATPSANSLTSILDANFGTTQGSLIYRTGSQWTALSPGTSGQLLKTNGAGADPSWATVSGAGTVTSVNASGGSTGLTFTGGPITVSGTLTLGGTLGVSAGGTGVTSTPTNGQLLIGNGTNYTLANISYGSGISVTNGSGSITITNSGVTSFSAGTTGFTPSTGTTGSITLSGTLGVANGGTGATATPTNGQLLIGNGTNYSVSSLTAGSGISITNGSGSISIDNSGVTSFSAGTTGFTPNTTSTGAVTLAGTLATTNGGTGLTSFTSGGAVYATSSSALTTGTLPVTAGGTGQASSLTQYGVVYGSSTSAMGVTAAGTTGQILVATSGSAPSWSSTVPSTAAVTSISFGTTGLTPSTGTTGAVTVSGTLVASNGGTGQSSYTIGDLLYASSTSALSKLSAVATGQVLVSQGTGTAPAYSATPTLTSLTAAAHYGGTTSSSSLTLQSTTGAGSTDSIVFKTGNNGAVTALTIASNGNATFLSTSTTAIGTLSLTNALTVGSGGTGATTFTANGVLYGNGTSAIQATGVGTTGQILIGNTGSAPSWSSTIPSTAGVTSFSAGTTGLTPNTGTTGAITLAGTLAVSNGGTGATTLTSNGIVYGNGTGAIQVTSAGTTGQILVGNTSAAPSWSAATSVAVTSINFGTTGLTPSTATQGAVTVAGTLVAANGGTGLSSYTTGDLLYASGSTTLSKLADVATGSVLVSGGVGTAPSWSASPTLTTSLTTPLHIGGTTSSSTLTLESTSGSGTSDAIIFKTGSQVEVGRIDTSGNFLIGTTSSGYGKLEVDINISGGGGAARFINNGTSGYTGELVQMITGQGASTAYNILSCYYSGGGAYAFRVRGDGTLFAQNTTIQSASDQRLKENIVDATDGLNIVTALKPRRFDWKEGQGNGKKNQLGFIAQEVEQVFPDAVDVWGESDDPSNPYKSIGSVSLIPVLVKAIQELKADFDAYKTSHP